MIAVAAVTTFVRKVQGYPPSGLDVDGRQYSTPTAKATVRHASTPWIQKLPCSPERNSDGINKINTAADTAIPARLITNSHVCFIILTLTEAAGDGGD